MGSRLRVQAVRRLTPAAIFFWPWPPPITLTTTQNMEQGTRQPLSSLTSSFPLRARKQNFLTPDVLFPPLWPAQHDLKTRGHLPTGRLHGGSACSWTSWTAQSSTTNLTNPRIHFIPHWAPLFYNPRGFQICYFLKHLFLTHMSAGPIS